MNPLTFLHSFLKPCFFLYLWVFLSSLSKSYVCLQKQAQKCLPSEMCPKISPDLSKQRLCVSIGKPISLDVQPEKRQKNKKWAYIPLHPVPWTVACFEVLVFWKPLLPGTVQFWVRNHPSPVDLSSLSCKRNLEWEKKIKSTEGRMKWRNCMP